MVYFDWKLIIYLLLLFVIIVCDGLYDIFCVYCCMGLWYFLFVVVGCNNYGF